MKRRPRKDKGRSRAAYRAGWSEEARERHQRLNDALRFRRLTRQSLGRRSGLDTSRLLNVWIEVGDESPGDAVSTVSLAAALNLAPCYLELGGPWLWSEAPDEGPQ